MAAGTVSSVDVTARRIDFLEWVRGIAAVLVVVEHFVERLAPAHFTGLVAVVDPGRVGVVAFFLVSGYIVPLSHERQSTRTFLTRRLVRLFPLYLLVLAVQLALILRMDDGGQALGSVRGLAVLLANLLMVQGLLLLPSVLGPAWTLGIEWVFYAQQVLAKRRQRLENGWQAGYLWLGIYAATCLAELVSGADLPTTLPMLLAVACVGHAWCRRDRRAIERRQLTGLLLTAALVVPAGAAVGVDSWTPLRYTVSFGGGLLLFAVAHRLRARRGWGPLRGLGAISYAMFLSHPVLLRLCDGVARLSAVETAVVCTALVPLAAYVLHHTVELPAIEWGRRRTATGNGQWGDPAVLPAVSAP